MIDFPLRYAPRKVLIGRGGEAAALYRAQSVAYPFPPAGEKWSLPHRLERFGHLVGADCALQQLRYRRDELSVELSGARHGKAVLSVSAPSLASAQHGWRQFLRRYADSGAAYLPRFHATAPNGRSRSGVVRRADQRADRGGDHRATRSGGQKPGIPHQQRRSGDAVSKRSLRDSKVGACLPNRRDRIRP